VLPTLTNLRHLSLEGCERHHIPCALPHDCCKLVQLTSLAFRYTPVTNEGLAVLCGAASSLKRLELNGLSHITGLPAVISRLTGLNTIELWGTRIATLPPDITALTGLRKLAWAGAGTPAALQPVWDLPALDYLAIGMHFTSFPADVSKLKQLRQLHIWGDRLEELSDSMTTLVGLERFSLRSERLQVLPAFITQLSGLTCIALHCRQLQALPPDVQAFVDARKPAE
jgi:Leucine-rich repeat (LRR) protein